MKKVICFLFLTIFCGSLHSQLSKCPILPSPVVYNKTEGTLYLPHQISIQKLPEGHKGYLSPFSRKQLDLLLNTFHNISTTDTLGRPFIRFQKLKNVPKDFYSIAVNDQIIISYANDKALYYAFQSLVQLIQTEDDIKYISKAFIQDYPKFEWRGLHLDVSRHFFSPDEVKKYIDLMALYKFNTFHWHLTDDQGWRIEIKRYPKLTEIGAYRDSTIKNHYNSFPRSYDQSRYGGFYTQEEIKDIVRYANERHIAIVPEIEMPGHSRAALAAYPEYSCTKIQQEVPGIWGVFEDIYCTTDETFEFLENILDEVMDLFPSKYIHVGGDEAPKTRWKECQACQNTIKSNNLANEQELQSYFIKKIESYLNSKNRQLIGWDEILEGGLSPNSTVMSWRGTKGGVEASKKGNYVVMTPGTHCYFDHYQGKGKEEPLAIGGFTPLEKVYDFNPIPSELDVAEASFILGGQANLWTEYISTFSQLEYMAYPRAIALSQALWCTDKISFEDFESILYDKHFKILDCLKVNYSKTSLRPSIEFNKHKQGISIQLKSKDKNESFHTVIHSSDCKSDLHFTLLANQPLLIERTKNKLIESKITLTSNETNLDSELHINNHKGLGAEINYTTQPNPQYNYSSLVLLDGQYGIRPWKGHEWIGFDTSTIVFEIELPKRKRINSIDLSFLKSNGSWIYLPKSIEIQNASRKRSKTYSSESIATEIIKVKIGKRMKKVRFKIQNESSIPDGQPGSGHTPWTFLDEIQFN
ncbi:MAG: beta-N-acetylhexosaminidase [Crocinitomicaceae bacterium]